MAINRLKCGNTAHSCKADYIKLAIEALEKQIPKKPLNKTSALSGYYGNCPCCNTILCDFANYNYCDECGQKLDWSE